MTSRNLNQTWRDVVFNQYTADHAADVPFPVRYLIHAFPWNRDIFIEIPTKIDVPVFRRAVRDFYFAKRDQEPVYEDECIKVRARVSPLQASSQDAAPAKTEADQAQLATPTGNSD